MACLFNPTELTEKIEVAYSRLVVPGLGHPVLQYQATGSRTLPSVEFVLDRFFEEDGQTLGRASEHDSQLLKFRAFLRALTIPPETPSYFTPAAPPRTLVVCPNTLTLQAVLTSVQFQYRRWDVRGRLTAYTATVAFEEILDLRLADNSHNPHNSPTTFRRAS